MPHHNTPQDRGGKSASLDPIFITVKEAARILALSPWQVYQMCGSGVLDSVKQGKLRSVKYASVLEYADSLKDAS